LKKYALTSNSLRTALSLTEVEFGDLKKGKRVIMQVLGVEEKFDVLMENYVELEETLFQVGIRHLAFGYSKHDQFDKNRNLISRRLLNLFSASRLYRDAMIKRATSILGPCDELNRIKFATRDSVEQPMPYRIMEVVRNYCQHEELPITSLSLGARWEKNGESTEQKRSAYTVTPMMNALDISKRRDVAADIRVAMSKLGEKAEVMPLVRKYLERWGAIHDLFRETSQPLTSESETIVKDALRRVRIAEKEDVLLAYATAEDDDGYLESIQLFDELFESLNDLRRKNGTQVNLSRRYVKWPERNDNK
jgi:hypothetical protein